MPILLEVFSFLKSGEFKFALAALAIAGVLGFTWYKGDEHGTAKLAAYKGQEAKVLVANAQKQAVVTANVVTEYIHDQVVIHDKA